MIYIIIPILNRWDFTKECLKSLYNQSYTNFKIIIVDHGSTDNSSFLINELFPNVKIVNGNESMWWTAATNLGVKYALKNNADYILTLNNDTITTPTYLEELINTSKITPKNSLIGSTAIDNNTNKVIFAGEIEHWLTETSSKNHLDPKQMSKNYCTCSRFPGRGLLISKEVFVKIGLYDENNFPHYFGDYEFTKRALKNGYQIYCSTKAYLKILPEESGANKLMIKKSMTSYFKHLFGMQGGGNLFIFYKYAFKYCPIYALPSFLFIGTFRRLLGYWLK